MRNAILAVFLALFAITSCLPQHKTENESLCNESGTKINLVVCFSDDFKETVEENDFKWGFDKSQDNYSAVTLTKLTKTGAVTLVIFRPKVAISHIIHEVAHIKEHYGAKGERGARFTEVVGNFVLISADKHDVPLYYRTKGGNVALGRGYEL